MFEANAKLNEVIIKIFKEIFVEQNLKNWWARRTSFISIKYHQSALNSTDATGLFRYPLKTSENQRFYDVFSGYRKRPVAWMG